MPDDYDDDLDDDEPEEDRTPNPVRKQLRKAERDLREARKQAEEGEAARRELAFLKAGVDPDDPKARYFVKGYDGTLDPTAIRTEAEAAGILDPPKPSPEVQAHDAANNVGAQGLGGDPGNSDADYLGALGRTQSQNEVLAVMRAHGKEIDNIV